ncbi:uncharacterized protein At4g14100-like [Prosopis cineraria]|uniref:uncharacterized protein At4g14100-like n=1 Tax=Prosopis cineraria TaxID=364024 RepID=UPI00240F3092|nr:uncharacterized protein At4g14100-like [Prosopis cineraria]
MKLNLKSLCLISLIFLLISSPARSSSTPTPRPWPDQFHALLYMNLSDTRLQLSDLWYDWPKGRNVNIFRRQLAGDILYDVEWDNGTSYYFTLGPNPTCRVTEFEVGIPRPDFLDNANYLGTQVTDGFLCHVWEKVDFIWYYEDVLTRKPVRWDFYDGISSHVITYEEGAVLPDSVTQAPAHCFNQVKHKPTVSWFNKFRRRNIDT